MNKFAQRVASYFAIKSDKGVTAIEYGLIATLIALAIIVSVTAVGTALNTTFGNIATKLH
jgi:pilus assembly protein Flp/PilA